MHCFSLLSAAAALLASTASAQSKAQIPPSFSPSSTAQLLESFQNNTVQITPGQQIGINVPASPPALGLTSINATTTPYVLIMVDPDVPSPQDTYLALILHWLQPNFYANATSPFPHTLSASSPAAVPYLRPMPPNYSSAHRYILYLFAQPAGFKIPTAFAGFSNANRTYFNLTDFASAAGLGAPVAANYFLCSNQTVFANGTGANGTKPATFTGAGNSLEPSHVGWMTAVVMTAVVVSGMWVM